MKHSRLIALSFLLAAGSGQALAASSPMPEAAYSAAPGGDSAPAGDHAPSPQARKELPYADCLRTDRINEWTVVDDQTVTIRNGPNHFVVKTTVSCPRMSLGGAVHFRASESDKSVGGMRICGGINEQVVRRDDPPCQIQSIRTITKAQFDALKKKSKEQGAAGPSGAVR